MSYILDALRRADAERQRGGVPGLHDQTGPVTSDAAAAVPAARRAGRPALWWVGAVAVLGLALGAAWWLGRGAAGGSPVVVGGPAAAPGPVLQPTGMQPPLTALPTAPSAAPPAVSTPVMPAPVAQAPTAPPAATRAPLPVPGATAPPAARPVPAAPPAQRTVAPGGQPPLPSQPPVVALLPGGRSAPPPPAAATAAPPPVADAASDPVRPWASLPESMRAALPPLAWSGVVYAERADQRLVVVNGQVAREGEVLGTGLQLLQIRPKSVLLRWQGQRIEMPL